MVTLRPPTHTQIWKMKGKIETIRHKPVSITFYPSLFSYFYSNQFFIPISFSILIKLTWHNTYLLCQSSMQRELYIHLIRTQFFLLLPFNLIICVRSVLLINILPRSFKTAIWYPTVWTKIKLFSHLSIFTYLKCFQFFTKETLKWCLEGPQKSICNTGLDESGFSC